MLLIAELVFIVMLTMILFVLYRNEILAARNGLLFATIEEFWDGKERRRYTRFKKAIDITYAVEKKLHLKNNCRIVDISEGGMQIRLDTKLSKGNIIFLKIPIPDSNAIAEAEGEIMWSKDLPDRDKFSRRLFSAGVQFRAIKEPAGIKLMEYIHSLKAEPEKGG